jgi:hypothetical protein
MMKDRPITSTRRLRAIVHIAELAFIAGILELPQADAE